MKSSKKIFFTGIIVIALGINFTTVMADSMGSIGTVFIAIGGLLFIAAMVRKKDEEKAKQNNS